MPMPLEHLPRRCEPRPRPTAHHHSPLHWIRFPRNVDVRMYLSGTKKLLDNSARELWSAPVFNALPRSPHFNFPQHCTVLLLPQHARLFKFQLCLCVPMSQTKPYFHAIATVRSGCALRLCVCVCVCACVHVCASLRARLRATQCWNLQPIRPSRVEFQFFKTRRFPFPPSPPFLFWAYLIAALSIAPGIEP